MSMLGSKRWVSDNESEYCSNCNDQFGLFNRKHHCRACGRLLCNQCCSHWLLIPKSSMISAPSTLDDATIPQRCCNNCARHIQSVQTELRQNNSKANATLRFDKESSERYMNIPVSRKLETDIRKAAYTLYNFMAEDHVNEIGLIPHELLKNAKGIVFVTLLKAGFLFSGRVGTGLVIARLGDGSWSAPSAVMMSGVGWGFQLGGELTDVVLILNSQSAVNAFCSKAQIGIGTELAVSVGPIGRSAGGDVTAGTRGASAAFSYAHSKGLFFGVSLEASVIACRHDVNRQFYGMEITPTLLLNGVQSRPKAAEPLYRALDEMMAVESPNSSHAAAQRDLYRSQSSDEGDVAPHPHSPMERFDTGDQHIPSSDAWSAQRTARLVASVEKENTELTAIRLKDERRREKAEQRERQERGSFNSASYTAFTDLLEGEPAGDNDNRRPVHKPAKHVLNDQYQEDDQEEEEVDLGNPHHYLAHLARDNVLANGHHSAFAVGNGSSRVTTVAREDVGEQQQQVRDEEQHEQQSLEFYDERLTARRSEDEVAISQEDEDLLRDNGGNYEEVRF